MSGGAFTSVLVANRGEIACRVIAGARAKGYRTVAVFSEADAGARHVRFADHAVPIGPAPVARSYLSIPAIVEAARKAGAEAVHPGYGFLAENAEFAEACAAAGLVFIGPPPEAIRAMGNKGAAKRLMIDAGVPCIPGYQGTDQSDATLAAEAARIGFPVMVKAAAGGGGRGMRLVRAEGDLAAAMASARSEALGAFGSDELILEKAVLEPRHVEIQVTADAHGNVVHLGERDCSVQRRHQKVLEEAPCPVMTPALRAEMGEAAVKAARRIGYVGAGTVEFLLDADGRFYFLEMNTRLQVEHPVTECVTGLDLVALQLDVAAGLPLPFGQDDVTLSGHAIEARLYAESPEAGFLPETGKVIAWHPAEGEGVRVDHGMRDGGEVSPFYDPMVAKVIAWGASRDEARRRLIGAIERTTVLGLVTNKGFLVSMLRHAEFAEGRATTAFIERNFADAAALAPADRAIARALAAALLVDTAPKPGPDELAGWWSVGDAEAPVRLAEGERVAAHRVLARGRRYSVSGPDGAFEIRILGIEGDRVRYALDGVDGAARFARDGDFVFLDTGAAAHRFQDVTYAPAASADAGADGLVRAPMNGRVVAVRVEAGTRVAKGEVLAVLEAMKMEHQLTAPTDGIVVSVGARAGDQVATRQILVTIEPV
jgi:geranyl-CoA carboxylase alpha subunit